MWSGWPLATQKGRRIDGGGSGDGVPPLEIPVHCPGMIPSIIRHRLSTCCVHVIRRQTIAIKADNSLSSPSPSPGSVQPAFLIWSDGPLRLSCNGGPVITPLFRDENRGPERLNDCPTSHSQWAQSWGSDPGLLAPPLPRPLCCPPPPPLQNLLLLWTLLNCGLGGSAQVRGDTSPGGQWAWGPGRRCGGHWLLSRPMVPLSPQVGSR